MTACGNLMEGWMTACWEFDEGLDSSLLEV